MDRVDACRLFLRIAERGSFSAAASELRIKQSTASKWVAQLEAQLGVALVERTTRALRLTDAGVRFQQGAQEVVGRYEAVVAEMSVRATEPAGRIRLSAPVVFGSRHVAPVLAAFLLRHPKVETEMVLSDRYVSLVEEGFDVAIRVGIPADTSDRGHKLSESQRCVVASPAYLKSHGTLTTPAQLQRHDCLVHTDVGRTSIWRFKDKSGRERVVTVKGRVSANNSQATLELARHGLGVALLADWLVADDLAQKRLVRVLPGFEAPAAPVYALTPPGRHVPLAVRAFIDTLRRELALPTVRNKGARRAARVPGR